MDESPQTPRFTAIVFDFDLTLADSRPGFVACHAYAAGTLELPAPEPDAINRTIGMPLPIAFVELYGLERAGLAEEYTRLYQRRADEVMTDLTEMLPGATDALLDLQEAGYALGIVSQKLRYRVEAVLKREGLLDCFSCIIGGEDAPDFKPDPRGLLLALERLGAGASAALYVGDTTIDADTAQRAAVGFIAVLTGYAEPQEFMPYAPLAILDSVEDLPVLLGV
jgi:phosphoglycolate phosphatase